MENNGHYNDAEFSWEYSAGAGGLSHGQMQMNQGRGGGYGSHGNNGYGNAGSQWLHSNQANTYGYQQQAMSHGAHGGQEAESSPFAGYNDAMMQAYTNFYKASDAKDNFGSMQGQSGMDMGAMNSGMSGMDGGMGGGRQRSYGGYSNNGLDSPGQRRGQGGHDQGWF